MNENSDIKLKNSTKRVITYRVLAFLSEFIIVYVVTGSLIISTITTPICVGFHTFLHYCVERLWKDKSEKSEPKLP